MRVLFIERKFNRKEVSIERLFDTIRYGLIKQNISVDILKNPYSLGLFGVFKTFLFFYKKQQEINHITGDIHWVSLVLKKSNTILTIHDIGGMANLSWLKKKIYFLFWLYLPIKKLKYITVISKKTKEDILSLMPWAKDKIRVIYNCYTLKECYHGEKIFPNYPQILIVGTRSNKNIERTILALKDIPCKLTIIGELSVEQSNLISECQLDCQNHVQISDVEILELYQDAHIVPFISTFEGFGLPILEGQSQNCIIITSNIEPMVEVAGKGAILVNPYDVNSIKDAFLDVISDKELRKKLITAGRENIKRFNVEKITNKYLSLYKEVLNVNTNR